MLPPWSKLDAVLLLLAALAPSDAILNLPENRECRGGSPAWTCQRLSKCASAVQQIKAGFRPPICSFAGREAVICCKPTTTSAEDDDSFGTKARKMCRNYSEAVYTYENPPVLISDAAKEKVDNCAIIEEVLITNGVDAAPKEFPHMALVGYGPDKDSISWDCGGSLISDRFVLSAAHCSYPPGSRPAGWVKLGDYDVDTETDDATPLILRIAQITNHPNFVRQRLTNDIALYKLERRIELTPYMRPACLYTSKDIPQRKMIASGWGILEFAGPKASKLQKVVLDRTSYEACNKTYGSRLRWDMMLCASSTFGGDSCQGDSGGPLQVVLKEPYCMYSIIGITSFGGWCGRSPGVYTRVSNYIDWIEGIVWP